MVSAYQTRQQNPMLHGAMALYDFFETLLRERDANPEALAQELADGYSLTTEHRDFLGNTGVRARRAQGIVRYLENRFGMDEDSYFEGPEGLYRFIFPEDKGAKDVAAHSYNIAVGFTRAPRTEDHVGCAYSYKRNDPLDTDLKKTISCLKNETPDLRYLSFYRRNGIHSAKEQIMHNVFGELFNYKTNLIINEHELRHVLDHIMNTPFEFPEVAAGLYAFRNISLHGMRLKDAKLNLCRDVDSQRERWNVRLEKRKDRLAALKRGNYSSCFLEHEERLIREACEKIERLYGRAAQLSALIETLPPEDYGVASYLLSIPGGVEYILGNAEPQQ